jgi:hypothetical protein
MMVDDKPHTVAAFMSKLIKQVVNHTTVLLFGGALFQHRGLGWAFAVFADRPAAMATALLAWLFGLRHAVDMNSNATCAPRIVPPSTKQQRLPERSDRKQRVTPPSAPPFLT